VNSQVMNTVPSSAPVLRPSQNQRGNFAPASAATPAVTTMGNAATPMMGLGKPNSDPCQLSITCPQLTTGLKLHDGV
jgi:hypothetical protein